MSSSQVGLELPGQKCTRTKIWIRKCGISVPIDGRRDDVINIHGLSDYVVRRDSSKTESDEEDLFELDSSDTPSEED